MVNCLRKHLRKQFFLITRMNKYTNNNLQVVPFYSNSIRTSFIGKINKCTGTEVHGFIT